jgi:hypothetical protein
MKPTELSNKKITLATLKSFAKVFSGRLFTKETSSFDGMIDGLSFTPNAEFKPTTFEPKNTNFYRTGIQGVYTVGSSRDYFSYFEDESFYGIRVDNCCGRTYLVTNK